MDGDITSVRWKGALFIRELLAALTLKETNTRVERRLDPSAAMIADYLKLARVHPTADDSQPKRRCSHPMSGSTAGTVRGRPDRQLLVDADINFAECSRVSGH